ncbi:MAG: tetratricopeptide repeat protein [Planctomycetaceae bacterium]
MSLATAKDVTILTISLSRLSLRGLKVLFGFRNPSDRIPAFADFSRLRLLILMVPAVAISVAAIALVISTVGNSGRDKQKPEPELSPAAELKPVAGTSPFRTASYDRQLRESVRPLNTSELQRGPTWTKPSSSDSIAHGGILQTGFETAEPAAGEADSGRHLPINMAQVDRLILQGSYSLAAELLEDFSDRATGLLKDQITLRRGLCAELLGDSQQALLHYQSLLKSEQSLTLKDAAAVAAGRLLMDLGRRDVGSGILMRVLLSRERSMRKDLRGDLVHTLAAGLTALPDTGSLLRPGVWIVPHRFATPEELLKSWIFEDEAPVPIPPAETLRVRALTQKPHGIMVTIRSARLDTAEVLQRISSELHWTLNIRNSDLLYLVTRATSLDFEELPLDVVLDSLLHPCGMSWTVTDNDIQVVRNLGSLDEPGALVQPEQLKSADRFLQLAVSVAAEHPSAPMSYLLLGATASRLGDNERAIRFFTTCAEQFPRSSSVGAASFNLGKAWLDEGQRDAALAEFFRAVDRISGPEVDAVSYIFVGRILLENDAPRDAVSPLMRGLSLAEGTEYEAQAAILLSAAYLMNGNPEAANTVLVDHRRSVEVPDDLPLPLAESRRQLTPHAAFMSSLVRFWGSEGGQRVREARSLLSALTMVKADEMFGRHNAFLVGSAFGALGLRAEQDAVFRHSLQTPYAFPLQKRMQLVLSGELLVDDSFSSSAAASEGTPDPEMKMTEIANPRADYVRAEAAFRAQRFDEVLSLCRSVIQTKAPPPAEDGSTAAETDHSELKRSALRLMGKAYQARGDHQQAVRCFAGIAPTASEAGAPATGKP